MGYFLFFFLNTNLKKSVGAEQFYKVYSRTSGYTFLTVFSVNNQLIKHTNLHTASVSNGPTKIQHFEANLIVLSKILRLTKFQG